MVILMNMNVYSDVVFREIAGLCVWFISSYHILNKKVGTVDNQNIFYIYDVLQIGDNYDDMTRYGNVMNIKNTYDD